MSEIKPTGRPVYGGKCSNLHKKIAVSNNSTPVQNSDILALAKETHSDFYSQQFEALRKLRAAAEQG